MDEKPKIIEPKPKAKEPTASKPKVEKAKKETAKEKKLKSLKHEKQVADMKHAAAEKQEFYPGMKKHREESEKLHKKIMKLEREI